MIQDEALVCHRHQASCLGGLDDRSTLQELPQKIKQIGFTESNLRVNIKLLTCTKIKPSPGKW